MGRLSSIKRVSFIRRLFKNHLSGCRKKRDTGIYRFRQEDEKLVYIRESFPRMIEGTSEIRVSPISII